MLINRRKLIGGLGLLIAAPAIVRVSSIMPVKVWAAPRPMYQFASHHWQPEFNRTTYEFQRKIGAMIQTQYVQMGGQPDPLARLRMECHLNGIVPA